jgi:hypothetical protein
MALTYADKNIKIISISVDQDKQLKARAPRPSSGAELEDLLNSLEGI